ncbi:structure-specific endonuclease subunit slx1 [Harpegnathos saltator]|uniref:Structure-specific endonuclease subunit SLX1 homolog n=1 Tax=Harpegnathos saltator TaxID=610380 RepID=E2BL80_HARSA|nr:structure-specific endonuclease subunit slx1 [Harpegnathos saltator]XP_025153085.1 structure-specific endonuclease subunit slx1 [Harpegnathos saltator]EFN83566.1 GIY-YIG domain-containing protein 1 [Harpegnathos saltator]
MEEEPEVVEHFFGVYLLYCINPKYKGRTYIGYTVDPKRRIKQHNAGKKYGGAWKTSNRGPWDMVLIVHGFPNSTSALRFEWAWQHPHVSRRLKHIPKKKSSQKAFEFCLTVLSEMLKVGPWCCLPLTIRWLDYEFSKDYYGYISPPLHMPICYGKVASCKIKRAKDAKVSVIQPQDSQSAVEKLCPLCGSIMTERDSISCVKPKCCLIAHLICLAKVFCQSGMILPIDGTCPACKTNVLWGDLVRKKNGCYRDLLRETDTDTSCSDSDDT